MKRKFRKAFLLICAVSLLLTCMPSAVFSEEVVMTSDPSPELFDQYPFLDNEVYMDDGESAADSGIEEEEPVPEEEEPAVQNPAPVEVMSEPAVIWEEPAPVKTEETPAVPENAEKPAEAVSSETAEKNEEGAGEQAEATAEPSAAEPAEAAQEPENTDVAGNVLADYVLNLTGAPDPLSWNMSGSVEAGKEFVIQIAAETAEDLSFVLTSGTELDAVLTAEEDVGQKPFTKENADASEETEAVGNRYTLGTVHYEPGAVRLIHLQAGNDAAFSLQVSAVADQPAEQPETAADMADALMESEMPSATATGETEKKTETNEPDQPEKTESSDDQESESLTENLQPGYKAWIASDEETALPGSTLNLIAEAEADLDDGILWQIKANDDAGWQNFWYGKTCSLEITDENANSVLRFKTADGVCSEEFCLTVQEPEVEEPVDAEQMSEVEETEVEEQSEEELDPEAEKTETEEQTDEEPFALPEDRSVNFTITCDGDVLRFGDVAHFKAELTGYEGLDYTLQWQMSTDNEHWEDIPGETGTQMDVVLTEENCRFFWCVIVKIYKPQDDVTPQTAETPTDDVMIVETSEDEEQTGETPTDEEPVDETQTDKTQVNETQNGETLTDEAQAEESSGD